MHSLEELLLEDWQQLLWMLGNDLLGVPMVMYGWGPNYRMFLCVPSPFPCIQGCSGMSLLKPLILALRLAVPVGNCCCCYILVTYKGIQWMMKLSSPALCWVRAPKRTTPTIVLKRRCTGSDFEIHHWVGFATCTGLNTLGYHLHVNWAGLDLK